MKTQIIIPKLEEILEKDKPIYIDYPGRIRRHQKRTNIESVYLLKGIGLTAESIKNTEIAAYLHDYGKRFWHYEMLFKERKDMNEYELALIDTHAGASFALIRDILRRANDPLISEMLNGQLGKILQIIKYHHKDYNGKGFPQGEPIEKIPIEAMALRIIDSYDAMRSPRLYRSTKNQMKNHKQALEEIEKNSGTEFHPELVKIFSRIPQKRLDELYVGVSNLTEEKQIKKYGEIIISN
jgi:HD-GYP domain-containing protein (c-di-GMP phosphodiesterase class II)